MVIGQPLGGWSVVRYHGMHMPRRATMLNPASKVGVHTGAVALSWTSPVSATNSCKLTGVKDG